MKGIKLFGSNRGQVMVLFALATTAMIAMGGLVADIGYQRINQQKVKSAADAAALAGALELPNTTRAREKALEFCQLNGFENGVDNVTIETAVNPYGDNDNWYQVKITKPASFLFGNLLGVSDKDMTIHSTAEYKAYVNINITGGGQYGGTIDQMKNILQVRGPSGYYNYGDCFSTKKLNSGSDNPLYNSDGYNFKVNVPDDFSASNGTTAVLVEVFDPDSYDSSGSYVDDYGNNTYTTYTLYAPDSTPNDYSDDILIGQGTVGPDSDTSEVWVKLDSSNCDNFTGAFMFDSANYGTGGYRLNVKTIEGRNVNGFSLRAGPPREEASTFNMEGSININPSNSGSNKFIMQTPSGEIDRNDLKSNGSDWSYAGTATEVKVRPKAQGRTIVLNGETFVMEMTRYTITGTMTVNLYNTHAGQSAGWGLAQGNWWIEINGEDLEITPEPEDILEPFNPNNGTEIHAVGKLPLRFVRTETTTFTMGHVPIEAANTKMQIKKFDTDIGAQSVIYTCDTLSSSYPGVLAGNGEFYTDEFTLPTSYTGGTWYVSYTAARDDDSVWMMWYSGVSDGESGFVGLVE